MPTGTISAIVLVTCTAMVCVTLASVTAPENTALIGNIGTTATLVVVGLLALARQESGMTRQEQAVAKIEQIHEATNGIAIKIAAAHAEGMLQGAKDEKTRAQVTSVGP